MMFLSRRKTRHSVYITMKRRNVEKQEEYIQSWLQKHNYTSKTDPISASIHNQIKKVCNTCILDARYIKKATNAIRKKSNRTWVVLDKKKVMGFVTYSKFKPDPNNRIKHKRLQQLATKGALCNIHLLCTEQLSIRKTGTWLMLRAILDAAKEYKGIILDLGTPGGLDYRCLYAYHLYTKLGFKECKIEKPRPYSIPLYLIGTPKLPYQWIPTLSKVRSYFEKKKH